MTFMLGTVSYGSSPRRLKLVLYHCSDVENLDAAKLCFHGLLFSREDADDAGLGARGALNVIPLVEGVPDISLTADSLTSHDDGVMQTPPVVVGLAESDSFDLSLALKSELGTLDRLLGETQASVVSSRRISHHIRVGSLNQRESITSLPGGLLGLDDRGDSDLVVLRFDSEGGDGSSNGEELHFYCEFV